jgi:steroid delta-isomerase-like uncharacterized protein
MASKNVETLRAAYESWNRRDFDGVIRNLADQCTYTDHSRRETLNGPRKFREYVETWAKCWSDGKIKEARFYDLGNTVFAEFTAEGTNDGPFAGLPPTRRHFSFPFCEIWQFDQHGRMTSGGCYYDLYTILTQLGHITPLAMAA